MGGGPCAQSGLTPTQVMIWNLDTKEVVIMSPVKTIDCHQDVILSMSFNTNGSLLATTCKDRKIRILDPRAGTVLQVSGGSGSGLGSEEQGVEWGQRRLLSQGSGAGSVLARPSLSCWRCWEIDPVIIIFQISNRPKRS